MNMSYCMFENTSNAMSQINDAMEWVSTVQELDLNEYEQVAFKKLKTQCEDFLQLYEYITDPTGMGV